MDKFLKADMVDDPVSNTMLVYGIPGVSCGAALVNVITLCFYSGRLIAACRSLWATYKLLDTKPHILKALAHLFIVFFWHQIALIHKIQLGKSLTYTFFIITDLQICFITHLVEEAFNTLIKRIKEYYELLTCTSIIDAGRRLYLDEPCLRQQDSACLDLFILRKAHLQLFHIVSCINQVYSLGALVIAFSCRFFFTVYLYRWIASEFLSTQLIFALLSFQRIFYICYRFEALKQIEISLMDMINLFDKSPLDARIRMEFSLFKTQLKSHRMAFNCMEMFDLDFSLITSILTTTITYLMLLQQLVQ